MDDMVKHNTNTTERGFISRSGYCGLFLDKVGRDYCYNPPRDGLDGNFCWDHKIEEYPTFWQTLPWITW